MRGWGATVPRAGDGVVLRSREGAGIGKGGCDVGKALAMTHVITLMTAKGGSGKTTLARGLLGAADARGLAVGFLDADKTTNTYGWAVRANDLGNWNPKIEAYQATDAAEVEELVGDVLDDGDLDVLIVDTPGDASAIHEALLGSSSLILCPLTMTTGRRSTRRCGRPTGTIGCASRSTTRARSRGSSPSSTP